MINQGAIKDDLLVRVCSRQKAFRKVLATAKWPIYRGNAHRKTRTYAGAKWRLDEYHYPVYSAPANGFQQEERIRRTKVSITFAIRPLHSAPIVRARLRKMSDEELIRFGRAAAGMCSPEANFGHAPRRVFVEQLQEARGGTAAPAP